MQSARSRMQTCKILKFFSVIHFFHNHKNFFILIICVICQRQSNIITISFEKCAPATKDNSSNLSFNKHNRHDWDSDRKPQICSKCDNPRINICDIGNIVILEVTVRAYSKHGDCNNCNRWEYCISKSQFGLR